MPPRALVSERFERGWYFRPANWICDEMDAVWLILLAQVSVHAHDQVQVFADRSPSKTSKSLAEVSPKNTKRPGNDEQHVEGVPPFPADQESAQVFLDLHHFQKPPGQ